MTCPCLSPSGHVLQRLERTCSPFQSKVRATSVPSRCTLSSDSSTIRKRIRCQMCRLCYVLALYLLLGVGLTAKEYTKPTFQQPCNHFTFSQGWQDARAGITRTKCAAQAVARGVRAASSPAEREQRADRGGGMVGVREAERQAIRCRRLPW